MRRIGRGTVHPSRWAFLFLAAAALGACGDRSPFLDDSAVADRLAARHGWQRLDLNAGPFALRGYKSFAAPAERVLAVYIEGDGNGWVAGQQQPDPTPSYPQALALAVQDPTPNRLYLARACQYLTSEALGRCDPAYWSRRRYAEDVVAAMSAAIDQANRALGATRIRLVGFSGGGPTAALVAARRTDVEALATVAANLDHVAWTRLKDATPLAGSLNPPDFAAALERIPQVHFAGARDDLVPPEVVESYLKRLGDRRNARLVVVPGADHDCCWTELWPSLLKTQLPWGR